MPGCGGEKTLLEAVFIKVFNKKRLDQRRNFTVVVTRSLTVLTLYMYMQEQKGFYGVNETFCQK